MLKPLDTYSVLLYNVIIVKYEKKRANNMSIQMITETLKANGIKSEVITTRFGYKMASVNLNSKVTFPRLLEVVASSSLNSAVEVKQFGKSAMVYVPASKV